LIDEKSGVKYIDGHLCCAAFSQPERIHSLLDAVPRDAVLQLFAPECLDVVPGLLASVRPSSRSLCGIATSQTHSFVDDHHRNRERDAGSDSHQLEHNPNAFLSQAYIFTEVLSEDSEESLRMELPTYVVAHSTIESKISGVLRRGHYIEVR